MLWKLLQCNVCIDGLVNDDNKIEKDKQKL